MCNAYIYTRLKTLLTVAWKMLPELLNSIIIIIAIFFSIPVIQFRKSVRTKKLWSQSFFIITIFILRAGVYEKSLRFRLALLVGLSNNLHLWQHWVYFSKVEIKNTDWQLV
jgi:hypothetical protein